MKKRIQTVLAAGALLFLVGCTSEPEVSGGVHVESEALMTEQSEGTQGNAVQETDGQGTFAAEAEPAQPATDDAGITLRQENVAEDDSTEVEQTPVVQEVPEQESLEELILQTEEKAAALEEKLYQDSSLTQADMNDISYEIYTLWDNTLNTVWSALKESLDEAAMKQLLEEQRRWITDKEAAVKETGESVGGGSLATLVCNQKAAELTQERVYELAAYAE